MSGHAGTGSSRRTRRPGHDGRVRSQEDADDGRRPGADARRPIASALAAPVAVLGLLAGCGGAGGEAPGSEAGEPSSVEAIEMLPLPPEPPPSGRLLGDMRQSSLDAAAGQVQVWVDNDTTRDVVPVRIVYTDPRFPAPVVAGSLRAHPAQAERGYPLAVPPRPVCGSKASAGSGRLVVRVRGGEVFRTRVTDETDVVGRYVAARCAELALRRVVDVSWDPRVADGPVAEGETGTLTLRLEPTGRSGTVVIESVGGSHLLGSAGGGPWEPDLTVRGSDPPSRLDLPLRPSRCDDHAFMEGGNATAFRLGFTVDGEPGQLLLRMDAEGMTNAIGYARQACGH